MLSVLSGDMWTSLTVTTPFTAFSLVAPLGSIVDSSGLRVHGRPVPTHLKPSRCHISGDFVLPGLSTEWCPRPWLLWSFSTTLRFPPLLIPSEATTRAQGSDLRHPSGPSPVQYTLNTATKCRPLPQQEFNGSHLTTCWGRIPGNLRPAYTT